MFASEHPLKVQISQGLGPFFQIELLKTGRAATRHDHTAQHCTTRYGAVRNAENTDLSLAGHVTHETHATPVTILNAQAPTQAASCFMGWISPSHREFPASLDSGSLQEGIRNRTEPAEPNLIGPSHCASEKRRPNRVEPDNLVFRIEPNRIDECSKNLEPKRIEPNRFLPVFSSDSFRCSLARRLRSEEAR